MKQPKVLVLVTGSRNWSDICIVKTILSGISIMHPTYSKHLFHGAAKGLDTIADQVAEDLKEYLWKIHSFPADWEKYGRGAGPIRNQNMLGTVLSMKTSHDKLFCFAFKDELSNNLLRGGTENMIKKARNAGMVVIHIEHM